MTAGHSDDPLVPGCPVPHPRWVHVFWYVLLGLVLLAALIHPVWWLTLVLGALAFVVAFHPACRWLNRHKGYRGH